MTPKTVSQIFPVMCQSLLKPHYLYTAWLHKISPPLIVCRICSINSIRNLRHGFADNMSKNNIHQNQASRGTNAGANCIQSQHFMSKIVVEKYPIFMNKSHKCAMGTLQDWPWIINQQWFDQKDRFLHTL
jgi:hypothetical protein